ncbi:hypothetical protein [Brucella intermedia]|uniref:hypothetical protein n=1 Tax=Brucella intermedia TaxID=94625 RepID=UPI00124C6439|nr:hypothetical protein [Brucella intermedia]KAB2729482.1 hypothetical protein F9L02_15225 [Brucella intermedia]
MPRIDGIAVKVNGKPVEVTSMPVHVGFSSACRGHRPPDVVRTNEETLRISDSSPIRSGFGLKVNEKRVLTRSGVNEVSVIIKISRETALSWISLLTGFAKG